MVTSGCTAYLPIAALCIRAGWFLGGVKYKYLFRERAIDQYFGRCAICLDQLKKDFGVSQPYFDFTELCEIEKLDRNRQISQFLETNLPRYNSV